MFLFIRNFFRFFSFRKCVWSLQIFEKKDKDFQKIFELREESLFTLLYSVLPNMNREMKPISKKYLLKLINTENKKDFTNLLSDLNSFRNLSFREGQNHYKLLTGLDMVDEYPARLRYIFNKESYEIFIDHRKFFFKRTSWEPFYDVMAKVFSEN